MGRYLENLLLSMKIKIKKNMHERSETLQIYLKNIIVKILKNIFFIKQILDIFSRLITNKINGTKKNPEARSFKDPEIHRQRSLKLLTERWLDHDSKVSINIWEHKKNFLFKIYQIGEENSNEVNIEKEKDTVIDKTSSGPVEI
ncbi:hypothetical protein BpHYR1_006891 [Brachionus plicatilis]|uniref:Uncharacterized protein n=1 Tax=Brachionus plicatilis TaxID=10195 RepID=A0A3M7SPQ0_BRAPC|nr:hypothetical protein BpHYR1_006891 [Brachionus plicatilis]